MQAWDVQYWPSFHSLQLYSRCRKAGVDMAENINISLILEGKATIEDLYILHGLGYEFVVEGGAVTSVLYRRS